MRITSILAMSLCLFSCNETTVKNAKSESPRRDWQIWRVIKQDDAMSLAIGNIPSRIDERIPTA